MIPREDSPDVPAKSTSIASSSNRHRRLERHRRLVAVGADLRTPDALRQSCDLGERRAQAALENEFGELLEALHREFVHQPDELAGAGVVAGAERIDVALELDRQPRSRANEIEERLVRPSRLEASDDRDIEAFLEHRAPFRAHAEPADVDDMRGIGEQPDDPALAERRAHDRQVVQMAGAEPGIVGDEVVALAHRLHRKFREEMSDALHHGIDVARRAGDGLREHPAVEVEDAGGEIARLANGGGEGGADHRLRLLLDDGDQAVPHDLPLDGGELCRRGLAVDAVADRAVPLDARNGRARRARLQLHPTGSVRCGPPP